MCGAAQFVGHLGEKFLREVTYCKNDVCFPHKYSVWSATLVPKVQNGTQPYIIFSASLSILYWVVLRWSTFQDTNNWNVIFVGTLGLCRALSATGAGHHSRR